ncbi:Protein N-acetyltransferase, RimJ/RimL family [Amphibacillus marinus]|uniref:Protein N-acetyltransferase, RimJ/RimL family n=1 Tax=Amphibacillus marinus TaxID=872970 RepID=A0A1H8LPW2_9BACI|nr:GNAT family N-acetyltransferase [Amphibacillus marinus]SEO07157.1 Protein N-acetyltransferase, RimJ/RimL family [Amphibacillus marinus]
MKHYCVNEQEYIIRQAVPTDAEQLARVRYQIDGETEMMDRVQGEALLTERDFCTLIESDQQLSNHLFLVAEIDQHIVGFLRCEGSQLQRSCHHVELGVAVLKNYWGLRIGQHIINQAIEWAMTTKLRKVSLKVVEINEKAVMLYQKLGFVEEGRLKEDKLLSDGLYYDTLLLARYI